MDEEKIFGPLTFRQFRYLAIGVFLSYGAYTYLEPKISYALIAVIAGITIVMIRNSPVVVIDESYIKIKRFNSKNLEEFQGWLRSKIAMLQAQISIRNIKGLRLDPKFERVLKMFEDALRDIK
ncbi:MAG: PrgI family protein [Patescibacteria group bacterium]